MTQIVVNSTADSGAGTLRAAIAAANNTDTIVFDPTIANQTIFLTTGTLTIGKGITIDGTGRNITVSGNNSSTVFDIENTSVIRTTIRGLTIADGKGTGTAGIDGTSPGNGGPAAGGVFVGRGTVRLENDVFRNNAATGGAGGSNTDSPIVNGNGGVGGSAAGAVYVRAGTNVTLTGDRFVNDTGTGGDGGTGSGANNQLRFLGGEAAGAVYVESGATVAASNLSFSGDTAAGGRQGFPTAPGSESRAQSYSDSNNQAVDDAAPCYVTGTLIRTDRGEVAVEDLAVGDLAVTASGAQRPIRWIGHRTLDPRRHPRPETVMPVRIRAHALGDNRPARDLVVSPGHAIALDLLGDVLVPARCLVNGATVVQEEVESITYWHIELDSHDLLIAENQAAESYLDVGNRSFFGESGVVDLHASPDGDADGAPGIDPASRTYADFCRPYHTGGPFVAVARAQMRRQAGALGWQLITPASGAESWAGTHLEVDGTIVRPKVRGSSACFVLPAQAREVWLVSPASVPCEVGESPDARSLGLCLTGLRLDDGLEERMVALDDPLLSEGFHEAEPGRRWTAGRARVPAALLDGLEGVVFLRLALAEQVLPRWIAPEVAEDEALAPEALAA